MVNTEAFGRQKILGHIQREAVGIIQPKGGFAGQGCDVALTQIVDFLFEQGQALVQGFRKTGFLIVYDLSQIVLSLNQLGVGRAQKLDHAPGDLREKRSLKAKQSPVA